MDDALHSHSPWSLSSATVLTQCCPCGIQACPTASSCRCGLEHLISADGTANSAGPCTMTPAPQPRHEQPLSAPLRPIPSKNKPKPAGALGGGSALQAGHQRHRGSFGGPAVAGGRGAGRQRADGPHDALHG